jgi:hypothetical protein
LGNSAARTGVKRDLPPVLFKGRSPSLKARSSTTCQAAGGEGGWLLCSRRRSRAACLSQVQSCPGRLTVRRRHAHVTPEAAWAEKRAAVWLLPGGQRCHSTGSRSRVAMTHHWSVPEADISFSRPGTHFSPPSELGCSHSSPTNPSHLLRRRCCSKQRVWEKRKDTRQARERF